MSIRAMLWAWDEAPVDDSVAKLILLALADEANDDGTDSCPYKDKMIERSCKSERTVQSKLRELYQARLINFGDQVVAMRRYGKQPGHAPRAWNLNLAATKANRPEPRSEEEMKLYARFMATGKVDVDEMGGVQELHPTSDQGKRPAGGVQNLHPTHAGQGGVQELHPTSDQGKRTYRREGGVQPTAPFPIGSNQEKIKTSRLGSGSADSTGTLPGTASTTGEPISFMIEDQEEAIRISDSKDKIFFPTDFSGAEQALFDECDELAGDRWSRRILRKVIGTPLIRKLAAQNSDLVRTAFLIAARDVDTDTPRRLLHMAKCPIWAQAALELAKPNEPEPQRSAPRQVAPVSAPPAQGKSSVAARDHQEYLEWKAAHAAKLAAKQAASVS